jgi:polyhydroxyalkanoate synthesis regulator phasin
MLIDDVWKTIEGALGTLTPTKARELAKDLAEPGAAKEQVAKSAADLMEWSQHNRERIRSLMTREMSDQISHLGLAKQTDLDALKKRVRELERAAGMTASGRGSRSAPAKKTPAKKTTSRKTTASKTTASKPAATKTTATTETTAPPTTPPGKAD